MAKTKIECTDESWNPVTGCDRISEGCQNCYALRDCARYSHNGRQPKYRQGVEVDCHEDERILDYPKRTGKSRKIFVNSMSDLFHKKVPLEYIQKIFDIMKQNDHHRYLILTKRHQRLLELHGELEWMDHVWMGVTVENEKWTERIDFLRQTGAKRKFVSFEPLLGPIPDLNLEGIDWAIVGGEATDDPRPLKPEWVEIIRDQCAKAGVPFFFKQWGGQRHVKHKMNSMIRGIHYKEFPVRLRNEFYTLGFGGRKKKEFLGLLAENGVEAVADVRKFPERSSMGIYKRANSEDRGIQKLLSGAGIEYHWFEGLGNPEPDDKTFKRFEREVKREFKERTADLLKLMRGKTVCLLCAEKNHEECHRNLIAEFLERKGWNPIHL